MRGASERGDVSGPAWVLVGLWVGLAAGRALDRPPPALEALDALSPEPVDLERSSALELRRLPGIGNRRAAEIVRARRRHDPDLGPLLLDDLVGIGPVTVRRVRDALAEPARGGARPPEPDDGLVLVRASSRGSDAGPDAIR